ncbi:MAG: esterase-like activity of phytase family protein [Xanthomonadales bacterium]|nr:esterase-like activity of phytase family protein [Xanthomonadales bacterium]
MACRSYRTKSPRHWRWLCALLLFNVAISNAAELRAIAVLEANSFVEGPVSGQLIQSANGVSVPFSGQPLQGFSDIVFYRQQWLAIADNGFGSKQNSADHLLMVYQLNPGWKTARGGSGVLAAKLLFALSDPQHKIPFPIVAERENYPATAIPVDEQIRKKRLLTGADFDIESFRVTADGSFWFGDEFGPFLLHTNAEGELLEAPFELPGLWSPDNPLREPSLAKVAASGGFENMAFSADGKALILLLEKPLVDAPERLINAYRFDLTAKKYTGFVWDYTLHADGHRVGAMAEAANGGFVLIERDSKQGVEAAYKKVFLYQPRTAEVRLLADLLLLDDPQHLATQNGKYRYPFVTIESVLMPGANTLVIINDNNYPFSVGRHEDAGAPDDSEMIVIGIN